MGARSCQLGRMLHSFLATAGNLPRPKFLEEIQLFFRSISEFEKDAGVSEVRRAIIDTATWFP